VGAFLDVRKNADESYRRHYASKRRWAHKNRGEFAIFMASSTDPFVPQEETYRVTKRVLEAMIELPPDTLILQTHSHRVTSYLDIYKELSRRCRFRVHLTIETDRERISGLSPHASPLDRRFEAAQTLKVAGLRVVIVVAPLLPIAEPVAFFERIAECADAVIIDHFIEGDGTPTGSRTLKTALPVVMAAIEPRSVGLEYRDQMVQIARSVMPGRVGVSIDGFAGRFLP
jgi:DNA repair photolyase